MDSAQRPDAIGGLPEAPSASLFLPEELPELSAEEEKIKRQIYDQMKPRRRKFVDRLGYDNWNPFQAPKDPLDIRKDRTRRTLQELVQEFMRASNGAARSADWQKGASQCAMGIIKQDETYQGIFDFCLWYNNLLQKEGHLE